MLGDLRINFVTRLKILLGYLCLLSARSSCGCSVVRYLDAELEIIPWTTRLRVGEESSLANHNRAYSGATSML